MTIPADVIVLGPEALAHSKNIHKAVTALVDDPVVPVTQLAAIMMNIHVASQATLARIFKQAEARISEQTSAEITRDGEVIAQAPYQPTLDGIADAGGESPPDPATGG